MADVEPIFKKKSRSRPTVARKRALDEVEPAAEASTSEVVRVARATTGTPFVQGSTGLRRAKRAKAGAAEASDDDDADQLEIGVSYQARKQEERRRSTSPKPGDGILAGDEAVAEAEKGLYKGEKAYGSQLPKGSARYGPVKGPDNVRTITMMDYKPDICKDYKETVRERSLLLDVANGTEILSEGVLRVRRFLYLPTRPKRLPRRCVKPFAAVGTLTDLAPQDGSSTTCSCLSKLPSA
jgi:hypothetical protein